MGIESFIQEDTPLSQWHLPEAIERGITVYLKHDYLTHPEVSGNKWRKLKYNLREADLRHANRWVTFGGAYSNHVAAVAAAGALAGRPTHAFIRGEELSAVSSETLRQAARHGMTFTFVSREAYRNKDSLTKNCLPTDYILPEGGTNFLALKGVAEVADAIVEAVNPTHIVAATGTGGTAAGFLSATAYSGKIIGVSVLKNGHFLKDEVAAWLKEPPNRLDLQTNYHFGGYGKTTADLLAFRDEMQAKWQLPLDKVYTAKAAFALIELIKSGHFEEGSRVVFYHSGGLQGG